MRNYKGLLLLLMLATAQAWATITLSSGSGANNAVQIQGRNVSATAPTNTQVITWNSSTSQWEPAAGGGGGGANTALSNVASVLFSADLIFDTGADVAIKTKDAAAATKTVTINSGTPSIANVNSGQVQIRSAAATGSGQSGTILIAPGSTVNGAGANILMQIPGPSGSGARGHLQIQDGSDGTAGHVWTSTDTSGTGHWATPAAAGLATDMSNMASPTAASQIITFSSTGGLATPDVLGGGATSNGINLSTGNGTRSSSGTTGGVSLQTGFCNGSAASGAVNISTSHGGGPSGPVNISTGSADGGTGTQNHSSGALNFSTGSAINGPTGDIVLAIGPSSGIGGRGKLKIQDGSETVGLGGANYAWVLANEADGSGSWQPLADTQLSYLSQGNVSSSADIVSSQDVRIYGNTMANGDLSLLDGTDQKIAQTFIPGASKSVGTVSVDIKNQALTLVGTLKADIFSDNGSGAPNVTLGSSDALTASTLNAGFFSMTFTFSTPVALTAGTSYWVVIYGDSTYNAGSQHITVEKPTTDDIHAQFYNGSVWAALSHSMRTRVGGSLPNDLGTTGSPWYALHTEVILTAGTAPAVSACGTSPSIVGNNIAGRVTVGSGVSTTSCTITFATPTPYANAPICGVENESASLLLKGAPTTTTLVITAATSFSTNSLTYHCVGYE